ncbi:MAG: LD-carboxypeptidase [Melioribacteraceae bacterium]|nr:LD-carboxypeptidase [Melioribacteraceae bacterium]
MKRRKFCSTSAMSVVALSFAGCTQATFISEKRSVPKLKAPKLREGDKIGLISPGSFITEESLKESINNIEKLGLKTYYTDNVLAKNGYLAGTDKQRADDINHMFANPDIKGIFCTRGGYGCNRILPFIDYELVKNSPKVLCGYSDVTALHYALYAKTGVVSFHGLVGISTFNDYSVQYLKEVLMKKNDYLDLLSFDETSRRDDNAYDRYIISGGIAEGELVGGNLSIAVTLLGTPYDADYSGKLVYFEDIGEEPYRIDRMLTELLLAGKLQNAAGIILGVFVDCEPDKDDPEFENSFRLREVLKDRLGNLGIPVGYGLSFGHISNKFTLPFGIYARYNAEEMKITLLEPTVF